MKAEMQKRYYNWAREEMLPFVPECAKRVLEIGCANGRFAELVKKRQVAELWGIEQVEAAAVEADKRLDRVIRGDVHDVLPALPDSYFDCVVCNDVLEHLADPEAVLLELRRVMTDDAVVVASIPNMRYLPVLYELLVRKDWKYRDGGILDRTHLRFFTRRSIERMFAKSGFEAIAIRGMRLREPLLYRMAFLIASVFTCGYYSDTRFFQFACVARPVVRQ